MSNKENIDQSNQLAALLAQVEALSSQVSVLAKDNESLAADNARLAQDIAHIKRDADTQINELKKERDKLIEQIKLANMRYFGSKTERVIADQLSLFNEIEAAADTTIKEPVFEDALDPKPRRRGGKRVIDLEKLETVIIDHILPEDARTCPMCESSLDEFKTEVTRTVKLIPAHLIVEEHRRQVYICRPCSKKNAEDGSVPAQFMRADMPKLPIEKSFASPSLIAYILNGKYVNALPLYRMEEDFKYLGIKISRQNMANWVMSVHERWLSLIHRRMKDKILEGNLVHCDETPVQVLKEPNRTAKQKSYMWLFCSPASDVPNYIFEYHPTRKGEVVRNFLDGWKGTITTDGYDPYFKLGSDIQNTACLVHVRRKFAEIVKVAGGDIKAASVASVALSARRMIDEIFAVDERFDDMDASARKTARLDHLKPLLDKFEAWAQTQIGGTVPKMALHTALAYALKYWPYVKNVLKDGRFELSNNIAERAIRPFAIGRKNFLFSDTQRGAHASAAIYSIVTTAKMNGLNPRLYLEWLLETMPNTEGLDDNAVVDQFLPWSEHIPDSCKLSPKSAATAVEMTDDPIIDIDPEVFDTDN
jgi:transposase